MLINFVGCPGSGKTTTAALVFAKLKELGFQCEFIAERARFFIAKKRLECQNVVLTQNDQFEIQMDQELHEWVLSKSLESNGLIISDSSPLNAALYMDNPTMPKNRWIELNPQIFYCMPIVRSGTDVNRIHTYEESLIIDSKIPAIMNELSADLWNKAVTLGGTPMQRTNQVLDWIINNF